MYETLRRLAPKNVLCIPANFCVEISYRSGCKTFYWMGYVPKDKINVHRELYPEIHFYPNSDLNLLRAKYGVDAIVLFNRYLSLDYQAQNGIEIRYDFAGWKSVFSDARSTIFVPDVTVKDALTKFDSSWTHNSSII